MNLNPQQLEIIKKFRNWTLETFGPVPLFDCRTNDDAHGNTIIDIGNMHLSHDGKEWFLLPIDSAVYLRGETLEKCLLEGLQYSIERSFINTYPT